LPVFRIYLVVALAVTVGQAVWFTPTALLGYRHESGVESKLLVTGLADADIGSRVRLSAGLGFSLFENSGVTGYGLGVSVMPPGSDRLAIEAAAQHQQWSDWRAGENRVLAYVRVGPLPRLRLNVGAALRAPSFDTTHYWSPCEWRSDAPEWNLLYGIDWTFFERAGWSLSAFIANHDRFTVHDPQQFPLGLRVQYDVGAGCAVTARASTAISGFSGMLLTFSEAEFEAGVRREF